MDVELIAVGNELLLGATVNTNAADLARALATVGARVTRITTVRDQIATIGEALDQARVRVATVILTGGLGPTPDDVTKQAVAERLGRTLYTDQAYLAELEARWVARGRAAPMPKANHTQAETIEGADVLPNPRGTAPGLWIEDAHGVVVLLPGVPVEMRGLLAEEVLPRLVARNPVAGVGMHVRTLRTTGIAESAMAELTVPGDVELAWLPHEGGVDLRVLAWGGAEAEEAVERAAEQLRATLGAAVYGTEHVDLAAVVLDLFAARGHTLAVAESCTGGMVGARLTAVPGSSKVFVGGVIAYANAVKESQLGVSPALLDREGAVSELVVRAMVEGVARRCGADAAVAVSGIAGPDGGTPDKPVGTVWLAVRLGETVTARRVVLPGDRAAIRERAVFAALDMLRRLAGG
jgi:nicotinamide-nucleotide amidase